MPTMNLLLEKLHSISSCNLKISGSKSETNRLLILQALFPNIALQNVSDSDDTNVMIHALSSAEETFDILHSGTAMRFLTAYYAAKLGRTVILTGSSRMKERPIKLLVNALRQLGGEIEYMESDGFPPIKITGKKIVNNKVAIDADISSQYITALLLIAPALENGLEISLIGKVTSKPYIQMTLGLLNQIGIKTSFSQNSIVVFPTPKTQHLAPITIESDWSSASYFYSIIALSKAGTTITLSTYKNDSLQGDCALVKIYRNFGVKTIFINDSIRLTKQSMSLAPLKLNLNDHPDLAQTIAVTCLGLQINCELSGLHTLKIKETDRLAALQNELSKLGAKVTVTNNRLTLEAPNAIIPNMSIKTYSDHRMAMAFAPLALKVPITIEEAEVVSKSYRNFWNDLKTVGFQVSEIQ